MHHPHTPSASPGTPHPDITCKQVCEFLCDYVEGALPPHVRTHFDSHLASCACCNKYITQYREVIALSKRCLCPGQKAPPPLPDDMVQAIVRAIKAPGSGCCSHKKPQA